MTRRPTPDDLTQRVDELQARLAAIEQTQASGASGDPERTTRRDMFRRAGITAAGVVGGAAGLSLLNAQTAHASSGNGSYVQLGFTNYASGETAIINTNGSGATGGTEAFYAAGWSTGVGGSGSTGSGSDTTSIGVWGYGNQAGVSGSGVTYGVLAKGGLAGVHGQSTGSGGVIGLGANTGVFGLATGTTGSGGPQGRGVAGSGVTGVLGNAGSGFGVKGIATGGSGAGVLGSGSGSGFSAGVVGLGFLGVAGVGDYASGSGGYSPDLYAAHSGRVVQLNVGTTDAPAFPSFGGIHNEQVRSANGVLWLSDGLGNWNPAALGGWGVSLWSTHITTQPTLSNSDGATWQPIDPSLVLTITPPYNADALLSLTGAPWSSTEGVNQDIGIVVGTSAYTTPSSADPAGWTESGGFNTFSPNGAATEAVVGLTAGTTYYITAVWKANKNVSGSKLFMGAGPLTSGNFSPTRLTAHLLTDTAAGSAAVTKNQPAPKRSTRTSKLASHLRSGKTVAAPAKRTAPKKAQARRTKLTAKAKPAAVTARRAKNRTLRRNKKA